MTGLPLSDASLNTLPIGRRHEAIPETEGLECIVDEQESIAFLRRSKGLCAVKRERRIPTNNTHESNIAVRIEVELLQRG
jgi:hypothetical protein